MKDLLVLCFSRDRAFQLDGLLRSYRLHCGADAPPVTVLFRCSDARSRAQYRTVESENPGHVWLEETDFGQQLAGLLSTAKHVLFLVDDSLFVRDVDLSLAVDLLVYQDILGVSLRLGLNCQVCYPLGDRAQSTPKIQRRLRGSIWYEWCNAELDWGYPLEVSSSIYRTETIIKTFGSRDRGDGFWLGTPRPPRNPNKLEIQLSNAATRFVQQYPLLACPEQSACFAIPWNRVADECQNNRAATGNDTSAQALADRYERGERLDVESYSGTVPRSCHQEMDLRVLPKATDPIEPKMTQTSDRCPIVVVSTARHVHEWTERCLESVATQTVKVRHIYVTDDADDTYSQRRWLHVDMPIGAGSQIENLISTIYSLSPETIVVWLDGDDFLVRPDALEIVAKAYQDPNVWMTYGQFRWPSGEVGCCAEYPSGVVESNTYRQWYWLASILRTFKAGLFQQLDRAYLRSTNGSCVDQLIMLPLLELAGGRHRFIGQVLAEYNTHHMDEMDNAEKLRESQELKRIRSMPPLKRLESCPWEAQEPQKASGPIELVEKPRHRLVLNMIVKDESAVIRRCLESCKPLIDSWCIVDTGSTDGTQDMVRDIMAGIPGELYERPWRDYGHNRTEALNLARPWSDHVLLMDADHVLDAFGDMSEIHPGVDEYMIWIKNGGSRYKLPRIVRSDRPSLFDGATHEALVYDGIQQIRKHLPFERWQIREYVDGKRHSSGDKYAHDIYLLTRQLRERPGDHRTMFYLAQSYRDAGMPKVALEWYRKRVEAGGWEEEVWVAQFQIGNLEEHHGTWAAAAEAFLKAYQMRPSRAESLYRLALHYRCALEYWTAYMFAKAASVIPMTEDSLCVEAEVYEWKALDELAICTFWIGKYREGYDINQRLLASGLVPERDRAHIEENQRHLAAKLGLQEKDAAE